MEQTPLVDEPVVVFLFIYDLYLHAFRPCLPKSFEHWEEIWFGIVLTGWPAKLTEPLHWLIYGAGAYGFWKMRSWMWPWAAAYSFQVVIAMVVFNLFQGPGMSDEPKGGGHCRRFDQWRHFYGTKRLHFTARERSLVMIHPNQLKRRTRRRARSVSCADRDST